MSHGLLRKYSHAIPLVAGLAVLVASVLMMFFVAPRATAAPPTCYAAIVLDKSGSVDDDQLETMRQQITRLFQPGGIYSDNVKLAFWSFSSTLNASVNYNAPFNKTQVAANDPDAGFVLSKGLDSNFQTNLYRITSGGGTNYEQGFGYDGFVFNRQTMNTRDNINLLIDKAQIIVLMTDGQPNTPGGGGDNNPVARGAARAAVLKHKTAGKLLVGGIIQGLNQRSLNYALNGSDTDSANTFSFSTDYTTLSAQLTTIINQKCSEIIPPNNADAYSLTPTVTSANIVVSGNDGASFSYNINNSAEEGSSDQTTWSVKRVLVDRGQSVDPLYFGNQPFRDSYSCAQLVALVSGNGACSDIASGQRIFNAGNTSLDTDASNATSVVLDDGWPVGTKICMVLTVNKPTHNANPVDRYSRASCLTIGKRPLIQIHGGDLRVGRHFMSDDTDGDEETPADIARVATSTTSKSDGNTYGSWVEYGVFSPGLIVGFASLSGLEGGYNSTLPNIQEFWSKLTFANTDNEYGRFTPNNVGQGTIPNIREAVLSGRSVVRDLGGVNNISFNGNGVTNGLYKKDSGNLTLEASLLERGKTVVVYVPEGTVTITGNISYFNGPYSDISQIPQLIVIAKRIAISQVVVHVSAWLISDNSEDGTVTTCDDPGTLTSQICNQQLRVDGPIMARHLLLRRTGGAGAGGASGDPAEIINLPADAYLWAQSEGRSDARAQTTFTTELPPYF